MHRFFVSPSDIFEDRITINDKNDIRHISRVLRLKTGDCVEVSDSEHFEYLADILCVSEDEVILHIRDKRVFEREPELELTLYQGVPKQGKMEIIVQKNTELGVREIVPVFMKRCVVTDNGKFAKKIDRWQKVAAESVKQCRRGMIPGVRTPLSTAEMIDEFQEYDIVLFPYENEEGTSIKEVLRSCGGQVKKAAVIIGPEGGFSDEEASRIVEAGGMSVSLGKTILRTETAGMAASAMIMYELEM